MQSKKIKAWDTEIWLKETENKTTLTLYGMYKSNVNEESCIDNTEGARLICRARTDTQPLNWRNRFKNREVECTPCNSEIETNIHFILQYSAWENIHREWVFLLQLEDKSVEEKLRNILIFEKIPTKDIIERKAFMVKIWRARRGLIQRAREE